MEISIHAPRVGSDVYIQACIRTGTQFQSTLPVWGATPSTAREGIGAWDFNPRSPCGERLGLEMPEYILLRISIHAPRVGSDVKTRYNALQNRYISIHAPRVGSDTGIVHRNAALTVISIHAPRVGSDACILALRSGVILFQSTLPVWGATGGMSSSQRCPLNFNPRSPCGERPGQIEASFTSISISIHAPRVGSDGQPCRRCFGNGGFQSTLPVWGATAPQSRNASRTLNFNPRSPCGERQNFLLTY